MKKKLINLFCFSCIGFMACHNNESRDAGNQERPAEKVTGSSLRTTRHVNIEGSDLYIIPPPGFTTDTLSHKIKKGSDYAGFGGINLNNSMTNAAYEASLETSTESKYPGVWKEEKMNIGGYPATLFRSQSGPGVISWQLYFADGASNYIATANYEEQDTLTGNAMYEALKTIVIDQ